MAKSIHLAKLSEGVKAWNRWRSEHPRIVPDLEGAKLTGANLAKINLRKANLTQARLDEADLRRADLSDADLYQANLWRANLEHANLQRSHLSATQLSHANLSRADLRWAELSHAYCRRANFRRANMHTADLNGVAFFEANLRQANLRSADLLGADFTLADMRGSNIEGSRVYGVSAWDVKLEGAVQRNLIITPSGKPTIEVDNLEVAQFIYLLLNNEKIREVIDTITSKVVLILGRFTPERKKILDALRVELRRRNYLPVLFDFSKPNSRDSTETISTLAHLTRFIIADITDAKSIPQELKAIVPHLPSVPVQPILLASEKEYGMFDHFEQYHWVLKPYRYRNAGTLLLNLNKKVISPAERALKG